jgi:FeS assembly SUF system protein
MEEIIIIKEKIIAFLKTIYDPEIPVNIYDLGLIYDVEIIERKAKILMTLTSPNCPMVDELMENVQSTINFVNEIDEVEVEITFEPQWNPETLSDEVKLELGML